MHGGQEDKNMRVNGWWLIGEIQVYYSLLFVYMFSMLEAIMHYAL
jgi:hypothetical protein